MTSEGGRLQRLQAQVFGTFEDETHEGLDRLEQKLLLLDAGAPRELVDELFRVVHTIKGGAGSFGLTAMAELAHAMEAHLDALRRGAAPTALGVAALLEGSDLLRQLLSAPADTPREATAPLRERLAHAGGEGAAGPAATPRAGFDVALRPAPELLRGGVDPALGPLVVRADLSAAPAPELLRGGVDPALLIEQLAALGPLVVRADLSAAPALDHLDPDALYLRWELHLEARTDASAIEGLFAWVDGCAVEVRPAPSASAASPSASAASLPGAARRGAGPTGASPSGSSAPPGSGEASVRVPIGKLDDLMNLVGELVIAGSSLGGVDDDEPDTPERRARAREATQRLARLTRALHDSVLRMRSLPVALVFNRFPRLVHDLGQRLGKEVTLELRGEGTELDKTVLERLGEPLVHLVRNSLDHGIEPRDQRVAAGKPPNGTIVMAARQAGNEVVITVSDDGRGLDPARIFARAVERGLVAADAQLTSLEMQRLVLAPGFSTAAAVSEVSGRGVGMDVVASTIAALGGELSLESTPGRGLTVTLRLPITLAIIEGQLVRFGGRMWVLPLALISECVRLDPASLVSLCGHGLLYRLRGQVLPVLDPCAGFGVSAQPGGGRLVMVLDASGERVALLVDEVMARQQIVAKSLEPNLRAVDGLAGATVLGDGTIAFILDIARLRRALPLASPDHPTAREVRA